MAFAFSRLPDEDVERDGADIGNDVVAEIIAELAKGVGPWRCTWEAPIPWRVPLRWNGVPYRGSNVVFLWLVARHRGYRSPTWMTFRQAKRLGGKVRNGEKSAPVVKVGATWYEPEGPGGDFVVESWFRQYRVFNVEQIAGLPARFYNEEPRVVDRGTEADCRLLDWVARAGIRFESSDVEQAYYDSLVDSVHLPPVKFFESTLAWAGVLLHETVHATGHSSRLDRDMGCFGSDLYAREELVAEIGSAMLGARLGLPQDHGQNAAYAATWIKVLQDDYRAVLRAATKAQIAADWLMDRSGTLNGEPEFPDPAPELPLEADGNAERRPVVKPRPKPSVADVLEEADGVTVPEPPRKPEQLQLL